MIYCNAHKLLHAHCSLRIIYGAVWGVELAYQRLPGVIGTCVGYTQGNIAQPTYKEVCTAQTGHTEAVQLTYDPNVISYEVSRRTIKPAFSIVKMFIDDYDDVL